MWQEMLINSYWTTKIAIKTAVIMLCIMLSVTWLITDNCRSYEIPVKNVIYIWNVRIEKNSLSIGSDPLKSQPLPLALRHPCY